MAVIVGGEGERAKGGHTRLNLNLKKKGGEGTGDSKTILQTVDHCIQVENH